MPLLPPGPPAVKKNPWALMRYAQQIGKDVIAFQAGRFARYGDTYTSQVGSLATLVTRDPAHIHQCLVSDGSSYRKPESGIGVASLRRLLGNGLLLSNGDFWRNQRRQIQPAFDAAHLRAYADTIVSYTAEQAAKWPRDSVIDASDEMMSLTLRIVGKVLMGQDVRNSTDDVASSMLAFRRSFGGLSAVLPRWLPYPPRVREQRALRNMHRLMDKYIDEHSKGQSEDEHCLLRVLAQGLGASNAMSRDQLRDEALTLFFAGHETTSHALTWTLFLLARHPRARAELENEVSRVLGDRAAGFDDFAALSFTQQCLNEGMRLYPPAPSVAREAVRDTKLGDYDVPAGAHVLAAIYLAQHDARWHPEPERFAPERFAPEAAANMTAGSYLPFGAGTRTCIGKRFALLEATLILATLAQNCHLDMLSEVDPKPNASVTLAPIGAVPMRVVRS